MNKRQLKKQNSKPAQKLDPKQLHLVAGKHEHAHTHTVTPISAEEIAKLEEINPTYGDRLFTLIEKSVEAEIKETELHYAAVEREQKNTELELTIEGDLSSRGQNYSLVAIIVLPAFAFAFAYFGFTEIAWVLIASILGLIIKYLLARPDKQAKNESEQKEQPENTNH